MHGCATVKQQSRGLCVDLIGTGFHGIIPTIGLYRSTIHQPVRVEKRARAVVKIGDVSVACGRVIIVIIARIKQNLVGCASGRTNGASDFKRSLTIGFTIGCNPPIAAVFVKMIRVGFQRNDIIIVIIVIAPPLIYRIDFFLFVIGDEPIHKPPDNHPAINIAGNIHGRPAATTFLSIGCLLVARQFALVNTA